MAKAKRRRRQAAAERARTAPAASASAEAPGATGRSGVAGSSRLAVGVCAALLLLTAAVYLPVVSHEFVKLDDPLYYTDNPHLDGHLSLEDVRRALLEPYGANWIPLTHLSIALGDALHGERPAPVLVTNVALHALAGMLLFLAFSRMTGRPGASAFVAAVFLVHPLHVESVAWASSRKDVLVGVCWMGTLYAYARYCERPAGGRYAAVLVGALLALLSKPTAVTLPFALLLLDVWPLRRLGPDAPRPTGERRVWLEKLPLFGLVAVVSGVTWWAQRSAGAEQTTNLPLFYRLENALHSLSAYLLDSAWPSGLAAFYPYPERGFPPGALVGSATLVLGVTAVCVALLRRQPSMLVGWLWFAGTLVPTIGLVQVGNQARADRYMYLPLVGLALAVGFGLPGLIAPLRRAPRAALALGCAVVLALAVAAQRQVRLWHDTLTLFEHAIAVTDDNYFALQLVGNALRRSGDLPRAEQRLREAVRAKPDSAPGRIDLATLLIDTGRFDEARSELEHARRLGADSADFHAAVGLAADRMGRTADAIAGYREALAREPRHREAANNLAWLLATSPERELRDPAEAEELARMVLARDPDDPLVLDTLAAAQAAADRPAEAAQTQARALARLPGDAAAAVRGELERRLADYQRRAAGARDD